ncbi:MAG: hypothetical protein V5A62_18960 [Haloarculaceae archaeon]
MDEGDAVEPEGSQDPSNAGAGPTDAPSPYRRRWLGYGLLALSFLLVSLHRTSTAVLSEGLLDAFAMTATGLGLIHSSFFTSTPPCRSPRGS